LGPKEPGFADIKRAVFGTDVYLAKFGSPMAALTAANEVSVKWVAQTMVMASS
jgi:hypothetical protein